MNTPEVPAPGWVFDADGLASKLSTLPPGDYSLKVQRARHYRATIIALGGLPPPRHIREFSPDDIYQGPSNPKVKAAVDQETDWYLSLQIWKRFLRWRHNKLQSDRNKFLRVRDKVEAPVGVDLYELHLELKEYLHWRACSTFVGDHPYKDWLEALDGQLERLGNERGLSANHQDSLSSPNLLLSIEDNAMANPATKRKLDDGHMACDEPLGPHPPSPKQLRTTLTINTVPASRFGHKGEGLCLLETASGI